MPACGANIVPTEFLHAANAQCHAVCDGRKLDPTRDIDSPECRGMPICEMCWLLMEHYRRKHRR